VEKPRKGPAECPEAPSGVTFLPERVANARLIKAAPKLYRACRMALDAYTIRADAYDKKYHDQNLIGVLGAALRDADGEVREEKEDQNQ
jgi:hypothetical protein